MNDSNNKLRWIGPSVLGALGLAALVAGLTLSPISAAARAGLFGGGHDHGPDAMHERVEFAADWILSRIDADEDQTAKVKAILADSIAELHDMKGEHAAVHEAVVAELTAETIDRAELERMRSEQLAKFDLMSQRVTTTIADIADVLRPEQRIELAEMAESFHGRHGRRHGRHGWH